jgi:hypothetical protein
MSQVPSKPEAKPEAPAKKGGGVLRVILIIVMLVMLALLAWDQYARAASKSAFENVVKWVEQDLEEYTPADVQKLLGRNSDQGVEDKDDYALETYSWPRGILVKTYFVKVIYRKDGDKLLLHEVVHNVEPEANDLPNPPLDSATPPTGNELEPPPTGSEQESSVEADSDSPEEAPAEEGSTTTGDAKSDDDADSETTE